MKSLIFSILITCYTLSALSQQIGSFTDKRDGKTYKTVKIGNQLWMAENLAFKTDNGCWAYDDNQNNIEKYGYLYNWETTKNICPNGWNLPSEAEFETLLNDYGENYTAAFQALIPGGQSGFSDVLAGWRYYDGGFDEINICAFFWSSSSAEEGYAYCLSIDGNEDWGYVSTYSKSEGHSVRCLKNQ
jgi:uncharacterized protein (TIGR02145 family)